MKTRLKRLLSGVLALAMVVAMMPNMAFAAEEMCPTCYGGGAIECQDCHEGQQMVACPYCDEAEPECSYCEGMGYLLGDVCTTCGGDFFITCPTCNGTGKVTVSESEPTGQSMNTIDLLAKMDGADYVDAENGITITVAKDASGNITGLIFAAFGENGEISIEQLGNLAAYDGFNEDFNADMYVCSMGLIFLVDENGNIPFVGSGDSGFVRTESTHEATTTYGSDDTNHWFTCTVEGCTEHKYNETAHGWHYDGKCKVCGADCKHDWGSWIKDPTYHTRYCSRCGKEDTNYHSWENSVCTVCSYGCEHESYNSEGKCYQCGKPCPHTFENGVCSVCGYDNPHKATTTYGKDGTNHWFTCSVEGCTEHKYNVTEHQLVEGACVCGVVCTHQWNSETGICNVCSMECPHFSYNENYACANCGKPCTHPVYNMTTGACQTCHKPCTHSWNATTGKCDVCAMSCNHDFDANHICTICGAKARIYMEDDTLYVLADGVNPNDYGRFSNDIKHIVFTEGVSSINYFGSMQNLETVAFSSTIRRINSGAFGYCSKLKKVSLNEGLETIASNVFFSCSSLTDINFPSTLKTIEGFAFSDCSSLTDVTFPAALTSIGDSAFQRCTSLKNVVFEHGVSVAHNTFGGCTGLESITFCNDPAQTTTIQGQPFYSCSSLKEVVFGASVKTIPGGMFYGCSNIEKLVIGNKDLVLNGSSFYNVGSQAKPVTLILPEDWERDVPVEGQQWNSGWFVLACNHTNMTWNTGLYSHVGTCEDCGEYEVSGDHVYVDGVCVCGEIQPVPVTSPLTLVENKLTVQLPEGSEYFFKADETGEQYYEGIFYQADADAMDFDFYKWANDGKNLRETAEEDADEGITEGGVPVATYEGEDENLPTLTAIFDAGDTYAELVFFYGSDEEKAEAEAIINSAAMVNEDDEKELIESLPIAGCLSLNFGTTFRRVVAGYDEGIGQNDQTGYYYSFDHDVDFDTYAWYNMEEIDLKTAVENEIDEEYGNNSGITAEAIRINNVDFYYYDAEDDGYATRTYLTLYNHNFYEFVFYLDGEDAEDNAEDLIGTVSMAHTYSEWYNDKENTHSRVCEKCYSEDSVEEMAHSFDDNATDAAYYTCVCGKINADRMNEKLAPVRTAAKGDLDTAAAAYTYRNGEVDRLVSEAKGFIDQLTTEEDIRSVVDNTVAQLPAAGLMDAKTAAHGKMDDALADVKHTSDLNAHIDVWKDAIDDAETIADVEAVCEVVLAEIAQYIIDNPYVCALNPYYAMLGGTFTNNNGLGDEYVIRRNADGDVEIVYVDNEGEKYAPLEVEAKDISLSEDGTKLVINLTPALNFTIEDGKASSMSIRISSRVSYTYERTAEAAPDHTVPVCKDCGKKMNLVAINENGCTWECDSLNCNVVSVMNHLVGGICICDKACIHEYGTEGEEYYTCVNCQHVSEKRKAEQKGACIYETNVSVQNGTFHLALGGKQVGDYTFEAVSGGWAIADDEGYLTIVNGKLTHTDAPAAWEYKNGGFSMSFKTTTTVLLFFKITKTTTYYLSGTNSVSTSTVKAVLSRTINANAHTFGALVNLKNGTHKHTCSACGEVETLNCVYDNDTHVCECGAYDPAFVNVKIDAVVEKVTSRYLLFFTRTTYRATITTAAEGTTVKKVEYSTNDGRSWKSGTSFTSSTAIEKFKVRVTDANGTVYDYTYPDDAVMVEVVE